MVRDAPTATRASRDSRSVSAIARLDSTLITGRPRGCFGDRRPRSARTRRELSRGAAASASCCAASFMDYPLRHAKQIRTKESMRSARNSRRTARGQGLGTTGSVLASAGMSWGNRGHGASVELMMKRLCTALAMSALVVCCAGCTGSGSGEAIPQRTVMSTSSPRPSASEAGRNRALAAAEVSRVLASIPIPPEAHRDRSPHDAGRLGHLGCQCGAVNPSLTRTRWWTVPISFRKIVHWYGAHSPANLGSAYDPDEALSPHGVLSWVIQVNSAAYSTPAVVVSYAREGPQTTAIRTDATLAARYDRTSPTIASNDVTRIDIIKTALGGPAHPKAATLTDPTQLTTITAAFNNLDGAFAHTLPVACGSPTGDTYLYAVTFHWPEHTLAVDPGAPLCGIGMGLTLDGVKLPQTLEDNHNLDAALEAAF
jgi:hypothetical protein